MNITLIGMPGSGKSYIGRKLADRLGYNFIEVDSILEKEFNISLQNILNNLGEEEFLAKESDSLIYHTKDIKNSIISPGGSIVYSEKAMIHLNNISKIFYLKTDIDVIRKRIGEIPRGIVGLKNKTIEDLYKERCILYEQWSSSTINADQDPEKIIDEIISFS